MIEYLHSAIRATHGESITVEAIITNDDGAILKGNFNLRLYDNDNFLSIHKGEYQEDSGAYKFTVPADATTGLKGRYFYCVCDNTNKTYCFKQPIYFV